MGGAPQRLTCQCLTAGRDRNSSVGCSLQGPTRKDGTSLVMACFSLHATKLELRVCEEGYLTKAGQVWIPPWPIIIFNLVLSPQLCLDSWNPSFFPCLVLPSHLTRSLSHALPCPIDQRPRLRVFPSSKNPRLSLQEPSNIPSPSESRPFLQDSASFAFCESPIFQSTPTVFDDCAASHLPRQPTPLRLR